MGVVVFAVADEAEERGHDELGAPAGAGIGDGLGNDAEAGFERRGAPQSRGRTFLQQILDHDGVFAHLEGHSSWQAWNPQWRGKRVESASGPRRVAMISPGSRRAPSLTAMG